MDLGREKDILTQMCVKAASPVEADKLGRILVPQALRQFAGLVKDVYVVGAIDEVEIWDRANYDASTSLLHLPTSMRQCRDLNLNDDGI